MDSADGTLGVDGAPRFLLAPLRQSFCWQLVILLLLPQSLFADSLTLRPEPGLCFERVVRSKTDTRIVKPQSIMNQTLEIGAREVGRVMDSAGGQVRIASKQIQSALKVNGQPRKGELKGASEMKLRVYSAQGLLLRSTDPDLVAGDVREIGVKLPPGPLTKGQRWNQTFYLSTGPGSAPLAMQGALEYVGPTKMLDRDAHEVRGTLRLSRKWTPKKLISTAAAGKLRVVLDAKSGMPLHRGLRFRMEQVREDGLSQAHVKAGGSKLGIYVDLFKEEHASYLGPKLPAGLRN